MDVVVVGDVVLTVLVVVVGDVVVTVDCDADVVVT